MSLHTRTVTENSDGSVIIEETELTGESTENSWFQSNESQPRVNQAGWTHNAGNAWNVDNQSSGAANSPNSLRSRSRSPGGVSFGASRSGSCGSGQTPNSSGSPRTAGSSWFNEGQAPNSTGSPRTAGSAWYNEDQNVGSQSFGAASAATSVGSNPCGVSFGSRSSPRTAGESWDQQNDFSDGLATSNANSFGSSQARSSPRTAGESWDQQSGFSEGSEAPTAGESWYEEGASGGTWDEGLSRFTHQPMKNPNQSFAGYPSNKSKVKFNKTFPEMANVSRKIHPADEEYPAIYGAVGNMNLNEMSDFANFSYHKGDTIDSSMDTGAHTTIQGPANFFSSTRVEGDYGDFDYVECDASSILPNYYPCAGNNTLPYTQKVRPPDLQSRSMWAQPQRPKTNKGQSGQNIYETKRILHDPDMTYDSMMPNPYQNNPNQSSIPGFRNNTFNAPRIQVFHPTPPPQGRARTPMNNPKPNNIKTPYLAVPSFNTCHSTPKIKNIRTNNTIRSNIPSVDSIQPDASCHSLQGSYSDQSISKSRNAPKISGHLNVSGKLKMSDLGLTTSIGNISNSGCDCPFSKAFPLHEELKKMEANEKRELKHQLKKLQAARRAKKRG